MGPEPPPSNSDPSPQSTRLIEVLEVLGKDIKRQNSLRYAFLRGLIYGLGTVIGATVLVALFGSIIVSVVNTFSDDQIDETTLEQAFSE